MIVTMSNDRYYDSWLAVGVEACFEFVRQTLLRNSKKFTNSIFELISSGKLTEQ